MTWWKNHLQDHKLASAAIDFTCPLPILQKKPSADAHQSEIKTLEFDNAFENHMLEPTMFNKAYNHKDPEQHAKWHAIIRKEFKDMNNHEVWCKAKQSAIPRGQCCIKSNWVFKIKRDAFSGLDWSHADTARSPVSIHQNHATVMNDIA